MERRYAAVLVIIYRHITIDSIKTEFRKIYKEKKEKEQDSWKIWKE